MMIYSATFISVQITHKYITTNFVSNKQTAEENVILVICGCSVIIEKGTDDWFINRDDFHLELMFRKNSVMFHDQVISR